MTNIISRSRHRSAILFFTAVNFAGAVCAQGDDAKLPLKELDEIAKTYRIEVTTGDPGFPVKTKHGPIDGKEAEKMALREYSRLFAPEFSLYPTDFVKRSRLRRVALCRDLSFAGQRRNAIPDYEQDTLYLDVSRGSYSKTYLRSVIHHEYFHVIDYRDDGSVYRDVRWAALNPGNYKYGTGGRNAQDMPTTSLRTDKFPGFLNHYSTTGVEEDKAELFANLIVDPVYVEKREEKDPVLQSKVKRMKDLLSEFCPEMNVKFWEKVRSMKRADE